MSVFRGLISFGVLRDIVGGELGWCGWVRVSCCEQGNELEASGSNGRGWTLLWACAASVLEVNDKLPLIYCKCSTMLNCD